MEEYLCFRDGCIFSCIFSQAYRDLDHSSQLEIMNYLDSDQFNNDCAKLEKKVNVSGKESIKPPKGVYLN